MKAGLRHYKRALKRHLDIFVLMDDIGIPVIYVPREQSLQMTLREMQLQGMREVLGITDTDLKQIYAELGPKYEVHLQYQIAFRFNDEDKKPK